MSPTDPRFVRPSRAVRRRGAHAFSIVEVMIAATIASFILVAVLSAFLMIGRNGYNTANYSMMEAEAVEDTLPAASLYQA